MSTAFGSGQWMISPSSFCVMHSGISACLWLDDLNFPTSKHRACPADGETSTSSTSTEPTSPIELAMLGLRS
jgi:hypothetical protein